MHSGWFRSTFLRVLKSLQIKEWRPNFCEEAILQKVWIICQPPLLYFNFKSFMDTISLSFIRFSCILHDWGVLFSVFFNFYKLKRWDLISGGNQFCRMSELFGRPFCISILRILSTQFLRHPLDFNAFCMVQEYFSQSLEISTNQRGGPNFWGVQFWRMPGLFGHPFCISILKVLWTQYLRQSLDFNAFCMIQEYFSQGFEISTN